MKRIGVIGLMLVLLTACSGGSDSPNGMPEPNPGGTGGNPAGQGPAMAFSAVFADKEGQKAASAPASQGVTRSGEAPQPGDGEFTTADLQASGFGVYCWYTGNKSVPDKFEGEDHIKNYADTILMLNQKVEYINSLWTYSPTKYWPLNASNKLTLRAYAPYVSYQLQIDANGFPMLPVVVTADDYHNGTQHDPLWGTAKHGGTDGDDGTTYGVLYDNYTYVMSGSSTSKDARDGTIDWYFHHGMSKLMFQCTVIKDPGCSKVTIKSITIENLYTQGLLSLNSKTEQNTHKPDWYQKDGNMTVTLTDLASVPFVIDITNPSQPTGPFSLLSPDLGLLIIPRNFESEGLTVTVAYTIDSETEPLKAKVTIYPNFQGNTSYTLNMKLTPSTKGLEITTVQGAFTAWEELGEGNHTVYNW